MALAWTEKMSTFYTLRFILGVAEASFYHRLIYYSTKWFPLKYRPRIVGFLVTASMVANMIGAPINGSLLSMHGFMGLEGWQWLFTATGACTSADCPSAAMVSARTGTGSLLECGREELVD